MACDVGGVRAIISKGWSSRMSTKTDNDVVMPEECYIVRDLLSLGPGLY